MPKLLVIEDDREINHLICEYMAETRTKIKKYDDREYIEIICVII